MDGLELLSQARAAGLTIRVEGAKLVVRGPRSAATLAQELLEHKAEILALLDRPVGDGQPPPLDRPPETEQELRRWMDHTANPENFARWLENLMQQTDSAEGKSWDGVGSN